MVTLPVWLVLLGGICIIIVLLLLVTIAVFYLILFKFENCYSYALREFRAGALYVLFRWSKAKWRNFRILHALVINKEGVITHWQPNVWTDSPSLCEWLHDSGHIKVGDE